MPSVKPSNKLNAVKRLARKREYKLEGSAQADAWRDFAWRPADIADAISRLKEGQCYASRPHFNFDNCMVDYYRAPNLKDNEDVYTHLFIHPEQGLVVIQSCKSLKDKT